MIIWNNWNPHPYTSKQLKKHEAKNGLLHPYRIKEKQASPHSYQIEVAPLRRQSSEVMSQVAAATMVLTPENPSLHHIQVESVSALIPIWGRLK